ncbi:hypothetical protein JCM9279_007374 [Rhodotorula babjevae]
MSFRPQDDGGSDALVQATAGMSLQANQPMQRPGLGTKGKPFPVRANAYLVKPPSIVCYHYDVAISPANPVTPPRLNRQIFAHLDRVVHAFGGLAVCYDGRSMMYSPKKLPADEGQWSITLPEDDGSKSRNGGGRDFTIKIRFTRSIDLERLAIFVRGDLRGQSIEPDASEVQSAIQALNVLIQEGPTSLYPSRNASFFLPPADQRQASLSRGLVMWRGFYSSLRLGPEKLYLNLDIASQPMVAAGSLPDIILDFLKAGSRNVSFAQMSAKTIPGAEMIKLNRFLKGLKVQLKVRDKDGVMPTRKIKMLEAVGAADVPFDVDGKSYTIESYFAEFYNTPLQRPDFPVVRVSKTAAWPIELVDCEAGQKWSKKLDPEQTADAIRLTTVGPGDRLLQLSKGLERIQPAPDALQQWGIAIDTKPIEVTARELQAPMINYKRSVMPRNGAWDVRGHQLYSSTTVERWIVVAFDQPNYFPLRAAQTAITGLVTACSKMGINIHNKQPPITYAPRGADVHAFLLDEGLKMMQEQGKPPQLIVCFLPRKPMDAYGDIKRFGDQQVGVATQCLFVPKCVKGNDQYFSNVALKVNIKMQGGINSILKPEDLGPVAERPTVLGGDVSHASPGSLAPSVASIVASMDHTCSIYGSAITVQPSRLEVIARVEEMLLKLLDQFTKRNGIKPERLIFLRDGISEGQFSQVIATEVELIRRACDRFESGYKPALTFICCGKRHKLSFFPSNRGDADPKTGNVRPGTIIDTGIVSPFNFDFYLNAHQGLLGTARSAHYIVLQDDSKFTADQLQSLVFNLSFTYARATRSVSIATPAFYASRLCTRAQLLLKRDDDDSTTQYSSTSHSSQEQHLRTAALAEYTSRLKDIHVNHAETLFYM